MYIVIAGVELVNFIMNLQWSQYKTRTFSKSFAFHGELLLLVQTLFFLPHRQDLFGCDCKFSFVSSNLFFESNKNNIAPNTSCDCLRLIV